MSTTLGRPIDTQQTLPRRKAKPRGAAEGIALGPKETLRLRTTARPRAAASPVSSLVGRAVAFSLLAGLAYASSSLVGQVMAEGARQQRITAIGRADEARAAEDILRQRIEAMSSVSAVEGWAIARGFKAPEGSYETRTLVARR